MTEEHRSSAPVGSADFFESIVEQAANPFVVVDDDLILRYASASIEMLLGWRPVDWVGQSIAPLLSPASLELAAAGLGELEQASRDPNWVGAPVRLSLRAADGSQIPVDAYARETARTGVEGTLVQLVRAGAAQTMSDAVDTILAGEDLHRALTLLTSLIEHDITDTAAMLGVGWDGARFTSVAGVDRLLHLTRPHADDAAVIHDALTGGRRVTDLFQGLTSSTRDAARRRGWHACWCAPVPGDRATIPSEALFIWRLEPGAPGAVFRDDINRSVNLARLAVQWMGHQETLTWSAAHDQLTALVNRTEFYDRLYATNGHSRTVLFCDLDDFKPVNERFGHRAGDHVLIAVAERMRRVCTDAVVARIGGDEFAILDHPTADLDAALAIAARVRAALSDPVAVAGHLVEIGVTIGVAFDPTGRIAPDRLIDEADSLLLQGKTRGKNQVLSMAFGD